MRDKVISFLKRHPVFVKISWFFARIFLRLWGFFVPIKKKTMLFCSFGGRKFDDSPKSIYDEVCSRKEFSDWTLIWAFVDPSKHSLPRGVSIRIDTFKFFHALLFSQVWISNSGMDRGIGLFRKNTIVVETWHGTPLKKICGEENKNAIGGKNRSSKTKRIDKTTIRCAQSEFDREIFARVFNADINSIILSDLPRNDSLTNYSKESVFEIKKRLGINPKKKVILYAPTYREYLVGEDKENFLTPPITLNKWKAKLGKEFVLLVRAHYAVSKSLGIKNDDFVKDVSTYESLNDLYIISDMMISDYSSAFFDYSILDRPMFCFAYDMDEYKEKRGLYFKLEDTLPCSIDRTEDELLESIENNDYQESVEKTKRFHEKFAPFSGQASNKVIAAVLARLDKNIKKAR